MLKSAFLQSLVDSVSGNCKMNVYAICQLLDTIDAYPPESFYNDLKLVLEATEGKTIEVKSTNTNDS